MLYSAKGIYIFKCIHVERGGGGATLENGHSLLGLQELQAKVCCVLSCSGMSDPLRPHGLQPASLPFLCPWNSRQEYSSGLPCPPPGHLPNPGIEPKPPALQEDSEPPGKPRQA